MPQPAPIACRQPNCLTEGHSVAKPLYEIIDLKEDQVLFIPLCSSCVTKMDAIGRPTEAADARDVVLVV
jgi:hypothetical protein